MKRLLEFLVLAIASFMLVPNISFAASKADKQAEVRKVANQTLEQLYKAGPGAKARIEKGGQATAAAQKGGQGTAMAGAMPVSPGVWLYQLTDDGLALEVTAKGTKYYKDEELN